MDSWYRQLIKPMTVPPDWVFGPVWTILYLLLAAGIILFVITPGKTRPALTYTVLVLHLIFNFSWSYLFFVRHLVLLAFFDCLLIALSLIVLMVLFYPNNKTATYLQIPYLLWVNYACYLNLHIYILNR